MINQFVSVHVHVMAVIMQDYLIYIMYYYCADIIKLLSINIGYNPARKVAVLLPHSLHVLSKLCLRYDH